MLKYIWGFGFLKIYSPEKMIFIKIVIYIHSLLDFVTFAPSLNASETIFPFAFEMASSIKLFTNEPYPL